MVGCTTQGATPFPLLTQNLVHYRYCFTFDKCGFCNYNNLGSRMKITYDPVKNERNVRERQLSFDEALDLDWQHSLIYPDLRKAYGESRFKAYVPHKYSGRLYHVAFTLRDGNTRIISFRKANEKERKKYEKEAV